MPRNMSFAMTTEQFKARTKTVTRRFGWWFLKPGDIVQGVEKARGLKKAEQIKPLGTIQIIDTRPEPLNAITPEDVKREGFPDWTPQQFIDMLVQHYKVDPTATVNRIEYQYMQTRYCIHHKYQGRWQRIKGDVELDFAGHGCDHPSGNPMTKQEAAMLCDDYNSYGRCDSSDAGWKVVTEYKEFA